MSYLLIFTPPGPNSVPKAHIPFLTVLCIESIFNQSENSTMNIADISGDTSTNDVAEPDVAEPDVAEPDVDINLYSFKGVTVSECGKLSVILDYILFLSKYVEPHVHLLHTLYIGTKINITVDQIRQPGVVENKVGSPPKKGLRSKNNQVRKAVGGRVKPTACESGAKKAKTETSPIQVINSHNLKRNDVVIKSILRSLKRYYKTQFLSLTGFKKALNANLNNSEITFLKGKEAVTYSELLRLSPENDKVMEYVSNVIDKLGLPKTYENMEFYVLSIAFPHETLCMLDGFKSKVKPNQKLADDAIALVKLIDCAMNRFSKKVFKQFLNHVEISTMTRHFLRSTSDHLARIQGFENCVKMIHEMCDEIIDGSDPLTE